MSDAPSEWPHVSRICYLNGGLTALNNPGREVALGAGLNGPVLGTCNIPAFSALYGAVQQIGLKIIGCEFVQDMDQAQGIDPGNFRVFTNLRGWVLDGTQQLWRQVAVTAMGNDKLNVADGAARIAFELQAVQYRLHELCKAYEKQLRAIVIRKELQEYRRFDDLNSAGVIHGVHALFYELAVLRDYVAEFAASFVFGVSKRNGDAIGTMAELRQELERSPIADTLATEILEITDRGRRGWLAILSAYRNLFTHIAPMNLAGVKTRAVQEWVTTSHDVRLPVLYHPLPGDVLQVLVTRKKGFPFERFVDWAKASAMHRPNRNEEPDALEYLHATTNSMASLTDQLVKRSPVAPQMLELGPDDILGPIKITRNP